MKITVKGYLSYRPLLGERQVEVREGLTVRGLLEGLEREIGEGMILAVPDGRGGQRPIPVLVNGRHCSHLPAGLETELSDGDRVTVFPPVAGG
jgi:molybdopterin synthase sulfur carrier subunit